MKVLLDDNKRFTGTYVIIGGLSGNNPNEVETPNLPPCDDPVKQRFYRYITEYKKTGVEHILLTKEVQATDFETGELLWQDEEKTIPIMITVPDIDEETGEQKYEDRDTYSNVSEWVFDEEDQKAYEEYIAEQEAKKEEEANKETIEEKLTRLEQENLQLQKDKNQLQEDMKLQKATNYEQDNMIIDLYELYGN